MKTWTYTYRGRPVKLFKKGRDQWSLRVEADPKLGLKDVGRKAVQKRLGRLGIDTRKERTTVPVKRLVEAAGRRKAQNEAAAILAALDARRRPAKKLDWYETTEYRDYCRSIGCDVNVSLSALKAGTFRGPKPHIAKAWRDLDYSIEIDTPGAESPT